MTAGSGRRAPQRGEVTDRARGVVGQRAAARRRAAPAEPVARDLSGGRHGSSRPRPGVSAPADDPGDLPALPGGGRRPHVARWWDDDGPDRRTGSERSTARTSTADAHPDVGRGGQRTLGRVRPGLPDRRLPGLRPADARPRRRRRRLPDRRARSGRDAASAPACCGRGDADASALPRRRRRYFAAPDHRNAASLRMLDKVGFDRGTWFDEPQRRRRDRHGRRLHPRRAPGPAARRHQRPCDRMLP